MLPFGLSSLEALLVGLVVLVLYVGWFAISRLVFHPLARYPGPKLAALTRLYEGYYDIVKKGQFLFKIEEMHKKYGPIVRITPTELHVKDSEFWDILYPTNFKVLKDESVCDRFGNRSSMFTTVDYNHHRERRGALSPMFSRRAILGFQSIIVKHVETLASVIKDYHSRKVPISFNEAYPAFTGDVIMEYSFGFCFDHLKSPDFKSSFHEAFRALDEFTAIGVQFPPFYALTELIPDSVTRKTQPALACLIRLRMELRDLIARTIRGEDSFADKASHPTIFREMLKSDLSPQDKTGPRMEHEAQTVIGAGVETTATALTVGTFHILNNPKIYERLHKDLVEAIQDPSAVLELLQVEQVPYLKACVLESLRLSYGVTARGPRVFEKPLHYQGWVIPTGTVISATIVDVHHDESIFPDSHSFIPERWLGNPKAPSGKPLDNYLMSFGKGSRSCIGINLAEAEMHLTFATIFRRFRFELFETDVTDVALAHDFFNPFPKLDTKGVRALVKDICL